MQSDEHLESLKRRARFESFEERLALSAEPVADFFLGVGEDLEHAYGEMTPALSDGTRPDGPELCSSDLWPAGQRANGGRDR